ncbi:MAG: amino acid ABC transporter substrate-binding protein [Nitrososphaerota archaeon]
MNVRIVVPLVVVIIAAIIGVGLFTFLSPMQPQTSKTSIRIGFSSSITGPYAPPASQVQLPVYQYWAEKVNARGGIFVRDLNKRLPVELVYLDDMSDRAKTIEIYEKLITESKVDLLLAPFATDLHIAIVPVIEKYKIPVVAATEGALIADLPASSYMFWSPFRLERLTDNLLGLLNYYKDQLKISTIGVTITTVPFTIDHAKYTIPRLRDAGYQIVYQTEHPLELADASVILGRLNELKPDVYLAFTYPINAGPVFEELMRVPYTPKIVYFSLGPGYAFFQEKYGDQMEGVMIMATVDPRWDPTILEFMSEFKQKFGFPADLLDVPLHYASVQIIEQAIEKAGSLDPEKIREALTKETFNTVYGEVRYLQQDGRWISTARPIIMQYINGEFRGIWPADKATAQPILPWSKGGKK